MDAKRPLNRLRLVLAVILLWSSAPGRVQAAEPARPAVTDFSGRPVQLAAPARRVVCLIESALSGIFMLGAQARLIGVSTNIYQESVWRYYAAMDPRIAAKALPTPGNWDFVSLESVAALRPDLVIIWASQREAIEALIQKKIPVYAVELATFDDVYKEIADLGVLLDRRQRAAALVAHVQGELAGITALLKDIAPDRRPGVYFMWAQSALATSGAPSTVNDVITLAGGRNVCAHIRREHVVVNLENLIIWRPQVIVMWTDPHHSPEQIMGLPVWRDLPAGRNRRVYELPSVFFCDLWTLKFPLAIRRVAHWCHPERFATQDLEREKRTMLEALYGPELGGKIPLEE